MSYTSGEWVVTKENEGYGATNVGTKYVQVAHISYNGNAEAVSANARLIAAAPDLAKALTYLVAKIEDAEPAGAALVMAREALAKAGL